MAPRKTTTYGYAVMALADWLMEKDRRFFTSSTYLNGGSSISLYEEGEPDSEGLRPVLKVYPSREPWGARQSTDLEMLRRLGGRDTFSTQPLLNAGMLRHIHFLTDQNGLKAFKARHQKDVFHYDAAISLPTKQMRKWWDDEGRAAFEAMRSKAEAERSAVDKVVLIGHKKMVLAIAPPELAKRLPEWLRNLPIRPRQVTVPYALARVVKVTPTRVYVDDVRKVEGVPDFGYTGYESVVKGTRPNLYVDPESVIAEHATPTLAARYVECLREFKEGSERATARLLEKILPLITEADLQVEQSMAQMDDMMAELLRGHAKTVAAGAAAGTDEDEDDNAAHP